MAQDLSRPRDALPAQLAGCNGSSFLSLTSRQIIQLALAPSAQGNNPDALLTLLTVESTCPALASSPIRVTKHCIVLDGKVVPQHTPLNVSGAVMMPLKCLVVDEVVVERFRLMLYGIPLGRRTTTKGH